MNVYLWANEIDPKTLGSLDLEGIYKGSSEVWTPAPSTIRLYLLSETDWQPSWDWMWTDDSYWTITYLDLPVGANWVRKIESGDAFVAQYNNWASYVTFHYRLNSSPGSLINFNRIEYRDSSDNLIWIFNLSQSWWGQQILPLDETWMGIQNNDRMVMVFETKTGPSTFTLSDCNSISGTIYSNINTLMWHSQTRYNYWILGNDWYWYILWYPGAWVSPQYLYWIKLDSTWAIDSYTRTSVPSQFTGNWMATYFNQQDESANTFATISQELWTQISNTQEFWEYIYNQL